MVTSRKLDTFERPSTHPRFLLKPLLCLWLVWLAVSVSAQDRPNLIVIYTDDHGWPDIGAVGIYDDLKTPHIDALAASGVRMTNGYVTAPQCVPSRAGLLSGRSQNRFGLESNAETTEGFDSQITIADRLKKAGYATGQIGKWHLGPNEKITDHGFDDVYSKNANRPCYANYTLEGETIEMQMVDDGLYHLDACSQAALTFIERHAESPFFLYLAYRAPHVPLDAPKKYLDRFPGEMPDRRRQALAMISAMDDGIGAIVTDLKRRGLTEKTLIFLIGDNGAPLKIHKDDAPGGGPGWDGSLNEPMNGEKGMLSEGGIRVPFLVSMPGKIPAGQVYDEPVWSLDVAATANALAGQAEDDALDGVNLIPYLSGEKKGAPHEVLTWRWISQAAIRQGNWKLLRGGDREYLYDIVADPEEKHNLRSANPDVAETLRARLVRWTNELQSPGLATGPMAETWNDYFDHYLEGKTAPPSKSKFETKSNAETQGWITRNGSASVKEGALVVVQDPANARQRPFVVQSGLSLSGPLIGKVRLRSPQGGAAGFAWRLDGQKDFSKEQTVIFEAKASEEWQEIETPIPAEGQVIHLRLLLPSGTTSIKRITLQSSNGKPGKFWDFSK
ncbi:MAG: sulfatase-like hydrolase/transferase [Verrucomicrobiae bacterium]|nr:sulfatase-like hydrolase/transferase [Verrucomicrobiae bacterium]